MAYRHQEICGEQAIVETVLGRIHSSEYVYYDEFYLVLTNRRWLLLLVDGFA